MRKRLARTSCVGSDFFLNNALTILVTTPGSNHCVSAISTDEECDTNDFLRNSVHFTTRGQHMLRIQK